MVVGHGSQLKAVRSS